jgi:hypothetical protein
VRLISFLSPARSQIIAATFFATALSTSGEVLVARTVLPDAAPSSFAVGLPGGLSFCFDPTRGGLRYIWSGGFADLTPARPEVGKFIKPITLLGDLVYRESGEAPLRRGDSKRLPIVLFKGYRLEDAAIEFRYTVDGVMVRERIHARPDGSALIRQFKVDDGAAETNWWYQPGPIEGSTPTTPTGKQEGGALRFEPGTAREFSIEIPVSRKQA